MTSEDEAIRERVEEAQALGMLWLAQFEGHEAGVPKGSRAEKTTAVTKRLTPSERAVWEALATYRVGTLAQLAEWSGFAENTVRGCLRTLRAMDRVTVRDPDAGNRFALYIAKGTGA